jgi:hypothetical protein
VGRSIALVLALLIGALIAWSELRLPAPAPANAPAAAFSAGRALADVALVAQAPHPTGSSANHAVRDRLLARMRALGLSPRVRRDDVVVSTNHHGLAGGSTETLIGLLPGRDPAQPALALMAHYDSVPGAPGAADDGAGVAAALEVVRALRVHGVPARDVAVVITDGEEAGLLGAHGFIAHDPLARRLGFILNLEARGSGGRAQMFETGRDNGAAIDLFRATAVRPSAGSLFGEVYAKLPNDTDFSVARAAGIAGFNYAFAGRAFDYHAPTDALANLQRGSLQDIGEQTLAAARPLAFAPSLPPGRPDAVYGVLFGRAVLAYPPAWGWLPLGLAAALLVLAARRARRQGALTWVEVGRGALAGLYALVGAAAVLHLAGVVAGGGAQGPQRLLAEAGRWEAALLAVAAGFGLFAAAEAARGRRLPAVLLPLVAGVASCVVVLGLDAVGLGEGIVAALLALALGGAIGRPAAWAGVLALGLAVATAVQLAAPPAAYVLAWPLLLGALAAAATTLSADQRPGRLAALALLAAIGLGWAGVHAHLAVVVTGLPELLCLPLFIAALVAWPLAQPAAGAPPERLAGRALLIVGAILVVFLRLASPWSARHPQPSFVAYQLEQDAGRAWRVTPARLRSAWSDAALRGDGGDIAPFAHWAWDQPAVAAPARAVELPDPVLIVNRPAAGLVAVTLVPPAGALSLTIELAPDTAVRLVAVGAARADVALAPGRWTRLRWTAPPPEGLTLTLRPGGPGGLHLRYAIGFDHWPARVTPPPPPPARVMAIGRSGETLATGTHRIAW